MLKQVLTVGLLMAALGCASRGTAVSAPGTTAQRTVGRLNVITSAEIMEARNASSVADVVRMLRPGWSRSATVFLNNEIYGDYTTLRNISASSTQEVRFLTQSEAQFKWGPRVRDVIQVVLM
jgi:hypothetical protein